MMHGRIWIDSEVGRGSTFHFTAEFGVAADQHRPAPAELNSLEELPVLVVDDNFTNRRILSEMLQHWHMLPVLAESAAAARQSLQQAEASQRPIRLILLDHHMPGEDGIQFAESLRGMQSKCPIIMISSGSTPIDVDLGQKYGIDRFMTKPVIASELLNEVLRQFGRYTTTKLSQPPSATATQQVQPRRVLLVEDNEINRRVAVGLMRSRGHHVVIAENGQEAVNTLADQEFDVVLMDMQMPVMDGYEATAEIRKRERQTGGHIPIVAMTAEALKGDRERCLAAGMDDYVSKPINPAEMYRAIERFPAICLLADAGPRKSFADKSMPTDRHSAQLTEVNSVEPLSPESGSDHFESNSRLTINWTLVNELVNESIGGGVEGIREFSEIAKNETSALLADIRRAIETLDSKLLRRTAHTFKSTVAYFGVDPLVQTALAMESLGHTESFAGASDLLATLEREHACFLTALDVGPPKSTS
jgi:CheY-like chemotaxis protein/HPt (histidine-containing phosphotransfer) domain-containing protein